jgi:hypothetical protein
MGIASTLAFFGSGMELISSQASNPTIHRAYYSNQVTNINSLKCFTIIRHKREKEETTKVHAKNNYRKRRKKEGE